MNTEEAWDKYSTSSIQKTSVKGMLDTMAAQINEIQQSTARTAELVPKILGDDAATQAAMEQGPQMGMPGMGGMGMPDMTGGEGPMATDEEIPEEGMPAEGMPGAEGEVPEEDMSGEEMPEEGIPEGDALGEDEDMLEEDEGLLDEDEDVLGEDEDMLENDLGEEISDTDMMGAPEEMGTGRKSLDDIAIELIREGKREEAQTILDAASRLGDTATDVPIDEPPMGGALDAPDIGEDAEYIADDEEDIADDEDYIEDDEKDIEDDTEDDAISKSAIQKEASVSNLDSMGGALEGAGNVPIAESAEGDEETEEQLTVESIDEMIAKLTALKESMMGDAPEAPAEVEVEIETEAPKEESEGKPNEEKNEELVGEDSEHIEDCNGGQQVPTETIGKSAHEVSFRELLEARMNGGDALAPFMKSSDDGEITDFAEFDPWGKGKFSMFKKNTQTIADELSDVNSNTTGNAPEGGDMLDDVDEEKGMSEGGTGSGDKLDEVTTENPSGEGGQGGDLLDDMDKDDGAKNPSSKTEDLLDTVDQKEPTATSEKGGDMLDDVKKSASAEDNGIHMRTLKEIAIKKSGTRPEAVSSMGGEMDRPSLDKITKSAMPEPVRMGFGVDPKKVIERDLAEYNLYKARKTF